MTPLNKGNIFILALTNDSDNIFQFVHQCAACQDSLEIWKIGWAIPFPFSSSRGMWTSLLLRWYNDFTEIIPETTARWDLENPTTCYWYSVRVDAYWIIPLNQAVASRTPQTIPRPYLPNVYAWLAILQLFFEKQTTSSDSAFSGGNEQRIFLFMETYGDFDLETSSCCGMSCTTRFVPARRSSGGECLADFGAPLHIRRCRKRHSTIGSLQI